MPIYEYQCESCGAQLEALQKMSDAPLLECPECKQPKLKKQISASGFRLKGGGWYETDFKSKNQKNLSDKSSGSAAKADTGSKSAGSDSSA